MFRAIELKFVKRLRRQHEFSIDSLQIVLGDDLLQAMSEQNASTPEEVKACAIAAPRGCITLDSSYGDVSLVLRHLEEKIIV